MIFLSLRKKCHFEPTRVRQCLFRRFYYFQRENSRFYWGIRAISVALGVLSDFAFALNNRGWAKSDSCSIALAGPAAPWGGRVSVLARGLFLWCFSRYGLYPRARTVVLNTHCSIPIFGRKV